MAALLLLLLVGCQPALQDQPRAEPLEASQFFANGQASRQLVAGTVARGYSRDEKYDYDEAWETGRADGEIVAELPEKLTEGTTLRDVLLQGQLSYRIYCAPCHGLVGDGDGAVVRRGYPPPPTYHGERLRNAPIGHVFIVATNGFGRMPDYGRQVSTKDRWAIAAYVRALQVSQNASVDALPATDRQAVESAATPSEEAKPE